MRLMPLLLSLLLLSAACTGADVTPEATLGPGERLTPTPIPLDVDGWTLPAGPITLDNAPDLRLLGELRPPEPPSTVFAYALSPDQTRLAALNNDLLLAWDLIDGDILFSQAREGAVSVYYSPDKDEIYTLDRDGLIGVFDDEDGTALDALRGIDSYAGAAAYDPRGGRLALAATDGRVRVWDLFERQALITLGEADPAAPRIMALAFNPAGERLAVLGEGGLVVLWDWQADAVLTTISDAGAFFTRAAFSPDGRFLLLAGPTRTAVLDVDSEVYAALPPTLSAAQVMRFVPDSMYLILQGRALNELDSDGLRAWDLAAGTVVGALPDVGSDSASSAVSPDGTLLMTSALDQGVQLWGLDGLAQNTVGRSAFRLERDDVLQVHWTSDGFLVLMFETLGGVQVWGVPVE